MKTSLRFSLSVILLITCIFSISADRPLSGFVLTMYQQNNVDEPEHPTVPDQEGNRKPSRPLTVYINSLDGLTIPGYDVEDILSYEIFTVDGDQVAVFTEEEDFISFIFSATGDYEIRLQFEDITLIGIINL